MNYVNVFILLSYRIVITKIINPTERNENIQIIKKENPLIFGLLSHL